MKLIKSKQINVLGLRPYSNSITVLSYQQNHTNKIKPIMAKATNMVAEFNLSDRIH